MNYSKSLTTFEQEEVNKLFSENHVTEATRDLCIRLYTQYRSAANLSNDRIPISIRCAFFISEKNQVLFDLKGQRIKGVGLSLNQFLKNGQVDVFMLVLKDFIKKVKMDDKEVVRELEHTYKKISFIMVFHDRFKKSMQKLEYPKNQEEYLNQVTTCAWLFFITTRKEKQFSEDAIENTFLLASILSFFVIYAWDYIRPKAFADYRNQDKKSINVDVQACILSTFNIKKESSENYSSIYSIFNKFFVELVTKKIIRMSSGKQDFLNPKYIDSNLKRLDHAYQSSLLHDDLDERLLLKQRSVNLTPSRFTPLPKQGYLSKLGQGKNEQTKFGCHRELEYDNFDRADTTIPIGRQMKQAKIPSNLLKTPTMMKPQPAFQSPLSEGMRMQNFLNQKCKRFKQNHPENSSLDKLIQGIIAQVMEHTNKKNERTRELTSQLMFSLFKTTIGQYTQQYPEQQCNEDLLKGFLAVCIELVLFVCSINLQFEQIQEIVQSNPVQEWKACDFLMKPDPSMPSSIRLHILDLEVSLISHKVFNSESFVSIVQKAVSTQAPSNKADHMQRCVKRIVHHLAFQTSQLCQFLVLEDSLAQQIFDIIKICITKFTSMIQHRHLDQIVICAIFCCCKRRGIEMKFNDIKQKYEEINPRNKQLHNALICQIYMENEEPVNIIKFYNKVFIPKVQDFLLAPLKQISADQSRKSHSRNPSNIPQILQSPLRYIIPAEMKTKIQKNGNKILQTPHGQKLLYAIHESPITRFEATFKNKPTSTTCNRHIDFTDNNLIKPKIEQPIVIAPGKGEGIEEMSSFFQKLNNKNTPTVSKQTSEKTLFYGENTKPNFQKVLFERR